MNTASVWSQHIAVRRANKKGGKVYETYAALTGVKI